MQDAQPLKTLRLGRDFDDKAIQAFNYADGSRSLQQMAVRQMDLSARSYHRVLKLARTISDLAGEAQIAVQHLAEVLQYRPRGLV